MKTKYLSLINKPVFTENGFKLGKVSDVFVEGSVGGQIMQYQVSTSMWGLNFFRKQSFLIHKEQILQITPDKILVKEGLVEDIKRLSKYKKMILRSVETDVGGEVVNSQT